MASVCAQTRLYVERLGEGPALVMLHGWAMHGGIWSEYAQQLARSFSVYLVDLPGHGYSANVDEAVGLDGFADKVHDTVGELVDGPVYLVGWSLGGLVALRLLLRDPQRIQKLQLIAANPSFVQREDWSCAVNARVLNGFATELQKNYAKTLQRFLALQLQGDPEAREHLRHLRGHLFERGLPSSRALQSGLDILLETDLRQQLESLPRPVQWLLGERDTLVPAAAAAAIRARSPALDAQVITGAGHAPFLSHAPQVLEYTRQFFK